MASGRPYTEEENRGLAQVAILGNTIATDLFGENDPNGKLIRIGNYNLEVIGVYEPRGDWERLTMNKFLFRLLLCKRNF